jgi:YVTN family beta-propeller protein
MKMPRLLAMSLLSLTLAGSYGCGSTGVVAVTITPTTATVKLGQTEQFTDTVTGNSNTSVTWSVNNVTGGNSTVGTISTVGLYTAPINALNASSVTVTATSVADTAKSSSATVTISSGAVVTVLPTTGITIAEGECFQFTDTVTNTVSNPDQPTAVYWYVNTVQGGNSSTGSITTAGYYCSPPTVGSTTSYTIKAILQADSTSYGSTNVEVVPSGASTLTAVSPTTIAQGSVFEDVYLEGTNFLSTSTALVNNNPVSTTFISSSVLLAKIPGSLLVPTTPGTNGQLFVQVRQQSGVVSSVVTLTTVPTAPTLISTTPDSVPNSVTGSGGSISVEVDGGYFLPTTTSTEINGQTASTSLQSNSNERQLNVTAQPSSVGITTGGLYPLNVRNAGLSSQIAASNFAVGSGGSPTILTTYGVGAKPTSVAVNTTTGVALVANTGSNTVSAFNVAALGSNPQGTLQLPTTSVGRGPTCVAIDNLLNVAFVVNNGDDTVEILDMSPLTAPTPAPATIIKTISSPSSTTQNPYSISVNSLTGQALLIYQNSNVTTFISYASPASPQNPTVTSNNTQSQISTTGATPLIAVEPKLDWALVTPGGNGSLAFVDLNGNGNEVVAGIAPPSSNGAVRSSGTTTITTVGTHGLSVNETVVIAGVNDPSFDGTFTVASVPSGTTFTYTQTGKPDTSTGSGNGTISAAAPLVTVSVDPNTRGVGINPETETAVLTNPSSTSLSILSLLDQSVNTISTSATGYSAVAINPLTNIAVAVNSIGNQATLIDLEKQQILTQFTVGNNPTAVAIDPTTNIALVVNQNDGTVSFIQLGAIRSTLTNSEPQIVDISLFNTFTTTSNLTITIVGGGFTGNSLVRLSETPLLTTYVSSRELTATVPSSLLASPIRYVLDVQNANGKVSNVKDFTVIGTVTVGTSPQGVAIDRDLDYAVVTNTGSNTVSVINLKNLSILGTLNVGKSPVGVAVAPVFGRAAVTNNQDDTVSVIDLNNIAVSSTVSVAPSSSSTTTGTTSTSQPLGIAIHPGSGTTVVADSNSGQVSFFNIQTPATPTTLTLDTGPNAIAIDPTQNIAAVVEGASNQVVIVDLASSQVLDRETGFQLPTGAMYDPDSGNFIITSSLANSFVQISAKVTTGTYTTGAPYKVGINPTALDYNYRSSTLVTVNASSQTVSVMDFLTKTVKAVLPHSVSQQFGVAIDPTTNNAVIVDQNNNRVLIFPLPR